MAAAARIEFETVLQEGTQGSGAARVTAVVSSREAWEALGTGLDLPQLDFEKETLVVVALGQRPDLSHQVRITGIVDLAGAIGAQVAVVLYQERTDGPPADVISFPLHAVRVPKTGHHFVFAAG